MLVSPISSDGKLIGVINIYSGNEALVEMASAMRKCLRENDTYARMSGDEFVIIFRKSAIKRDEIFSCADRMLFIEKKKVGR
ncbi:diguanylate cyclase [Clostridium paraputrificum]|uniref:diguanylate cyclase domain-containing protein n=1 Tax=Clostridium paraputrificum TaxID=29363 RepID=UPI00325B0AFD